MRRWVALIGVLLRASFAKARSSLVFVRPQSIRLRPTPPVGSGPVLDGMVA